VLVSGPPGCGKRLVVRAVAKQCRMHILECNCYEFSNEVVAYAERNFVLQFRIAFDSAPVVLLLHHVHMLGKRSDTHEGTDNHSEVRALTFDPYSPCRSPSMCGV